MSYRKARIRIISIPCCIDLSSSLQVISNLPFFPMIKDSLFLVPIVFENEQEMVLFITKFFL